VSSWLSFFAHRTGLVLTTHLAIRLDPKAGEAIRQATAGTACGSGFNYLELVA
jgi:hypothetical protein